MYPVQYSNSCHSPVERPRGLLRQLIGSNYRQIWRRVACELGGIFTDGGRWGLTSAMAPFGPWRIVLESCDRTNSRYRLPPMRLRVPYADCDYLRFRAQPAGFLTPIARRFSAVYVETGDASFDEIISLTGNDAGQILQVFADLRLREILGMQQLFRLECRPSTVHWSGAPHNLAELCFESQLLLTNPYRVRELFEMMGLTIEALQRIGSAEPVADAR